MASAEIRQFPGEALLESFESEYSILADQTFVNGDLNNELSSKDSDASNLHTALMTSTPDMSLEQMHKCIAEVCEENLALRNKLEQSTKLLEQHLATTIIWHNEKTTLHSNLRTQLEKIAELEAQNSQLQSKMKEIENKIKKDSSPFSEEEVGFEMVNKKELKMDLEKNSESEAHNEVTSVKRLDEAKIDSNFAIEQLKKQVETLELSLTKKQSELEEEKTIHSETQKMLNTVQTNYDRVTKLLQVQSKDEREKKCVDEREMIDRKYLEKIDSLTAQLLAAEDKLQDQELKVKSMATELESMKGGSENVPNLIKIDNYVDVEREMDTKMYLDQIDALTSELVAAKEKLQEEEVKVQSMTSELHTMKEESESIPILKSQIEVYKIDLNSALLARDAAEEEVNRLTKQIHETPSVSLCDSCGGNISMISEGSRGNGKKSVGSKIKRHELIQRDNVFVCPVCKVIFTCVQAIENHANDCLDRSEREKH